MNILMVSSFLPYPLFSGGHVRLFNIIKRLSKKNDITLVCEKRNYQKGEDLEELRKICKKVIAFDRKKQWSIANIAKTAFSSYPFLMIGHTNSLIKKQIENLLRTEKFDLIHVETFYVAQNLPKTEIPVVLVEHNIEYLVYERFLGRISPIFRPFLMIDIRKIKKWEKRFWRKAVKLIAVSEQEKRLMEREDTQVVPNGVDITKFKVQSSKCKANDGEKRVLFIGDFKWIQNRDAVEWIIKEIWPKLRSKIKDQRSKIDVRLWIVGRKIPDSIKKMVKDENIILDENAPEDASEIYQKADILLAPIRVGGGTSFKILEAMASGVPVVATALGVEGIDARIGKEVLIAESVEEFSDKIIDLLNDKKLYSFLAMNARKLVEDKYNWDIIVEKLEGVYKSIW